MRGYGDTATPIKHVIVIIGENHTFDNPFATYRPPAGPTVKNLLSEGIVAASGASGGNVSKANQQTATDTTKYQIDPPDTGPYKTLPQPNTTYVSPACDGQGGNTADTRFPGNLPNAPYQITKYVPYFDSHGQYAGSGTCEFIGAFTGDPLHRFYQMYQQVSDNKNDLWTWVHETAGDSNGDPPPSPFTDQSTNQGALDMGFYNMASGDVPVLNFLARHYSMSDNYHQSVMGGTGANHIMLATGDAAFTSTRMATRRHRLRVRSRIPTPSPGPITSTRKMGTAKPAPPTAAAIRTAPTTQRPALAGCSPTWTASRTSRSAAVTALRGITTCSTTTTPATTSTVR